MIIGKGDLAKVLKDRPGRLYFAAGVSNSREERESEYQREIDLLMHQDHTRHIVYFSSICVFYNDNRYTKHKRQMEKLVKLFPHYTIVRLGNISWGDNPNTLLNYFRNKIKKNEPLEIWDVYRYVIDKDEFLYWMDMLPDWNCEVNVIGKRFKVQEIIDDIRSNKF